MINVNGPKVLPKANQPQAATIGSSIKWVNVFLLIEEYLANNDGFVDACSFFIFRTGL